MPTTHLNACMRRVVRDMHLVVSATLVRGRVAEGSDIPKLEAESNCTCTLFVHFRCIHLYCVAGLSYQEKGPDLIHCTPTAGETYHHKQLTARR